MTVAAWIMVAYLAGSDFQPARIAKDFPSAAHCEQAIDTYRKKLGIPKSITVGCKPEEKS